MQNMTTQHEYDNLMRDNTINDGKNMELTNWLLQIKKIVLYWQIVKNMN